MHNQKIPVYVLCGADAQYRLAFYHQFSQAKAPLYVTFMDDALLKNEGTETVCRLPGHITPKDAGREIAIRLEYETHDAVWLNWGDRPIDQLLQISQQSSFQRSCKLKRIVYCADRDAILPAINDTDKRAQLAQCDILAVPQAQRRELRKLYHRVLPVQPNIKLVSYESTAQVAKALHRRDTRRGLQVLILAAIIALLFFALHTLNYTVPDTMATFLGTYLQALPFLMLGILLSSAIQVFVPADLLQRIFPKSHLGGMIFGVLGGFLLPICDCASIPVFRSLLRKGVPLPAAVTFMIAAPIINPVVLLSTYYAFGGSVPIMLTRMGFGIVCSVIIGLFFAREKKQVLLAGATAPVCACGIEHSHSQPHDHHHDHNHDHHHHHDGETCDCGHHHTEPHEKSTVIGKLKALLTHFQAEFFEVFRFLLIGIGVSTVLQLVMGSRIMAMQISDLAISMLVMMALAFFLSLCSSSDAVVGRNMGASLPIGAVMGFMVFGPMIDVKNMILMSASFTKHFMIKLLIVTFAVSFVVVYLAFSLGLGGLIA